MTSQPKKWEKISSEVVFDKYGRSIEKVIFKLPDGATTDYFLKREGPACGVLALTEEHKVILAKQYRPGPDEIYFDLPGGYVDPGEDPLVAVKRELMEETGYSGEVQFVTNYFESAYSSMKIYCYVATNCHKVGEAKLEIEENIEVATVPVEEYRQLLVSGQCGDIAIGYLGLDYLKLL